MKVSDLKPNPKNPRTATKEKIELLKRTLAEFGDLGGVVFNRKTKRLVGGHQRTKAIPAGTLIHIEKQHKKPTKAGTVATGFLELNGERLSYREVDWDETKEKAANIAANKGVGEWDFEGLKNWLSEIDEFGFDLDLTLFDAEERAAIFDDEDSVSGGTPDKADLYTKKIVAPIYEPKGEKPKPVELYDKKKAEALLTAIEKVKTPEDVKAFLRVAANRHVVFDYAKIAEFYAHASKEVQELMEDSALVIIDFDKAIENGFVQLSEEIADAYRADHAEE